MFFLYKVHWFAWLESGWYHAEKDWERRLLDVQPADEIAHPIFPFVNEADPSNVEATTKVCGGL